MATINRTDHETFFNRELEAMEAEVRAYMEAEALKLLKNARLFVGIYKGKDEDRGNIVVKFNKGKAPYLKVPYSVFTLPVGLTLDKWGDIPYKTLRQQALTGSDALPIYMMSAKEPEYIMVGMTHIDLIFAEQLKPGSLLVVAEREPPFEYILNLKNLVRATPPHTPAGDILDIPIHLTNWNPVPLSGDNIMAQVLEMFHQQEVTVVQGPPGTGKTHLMARLCDYFLEQQQSVLVTALTNKALSELAEKNPLQPWLTAKKIKKRPVLLEEKQKMPQLMQAEYLMPVPGELLLATFYQMSKVAVAHPEYDFDVVIVEEASQGFLATLAATRLLGKKMIIVGDQQQLQPVVLQARPESVHPDILFAVNGLATFANNSVFQGTRLIETYRLTPRATLQTGSFYENMLVSRSTTPIPITLDSGYASLFDPEGGCTVYHLDITDEGKIPKTAILLIKDILVDLHKAHPDFSIAVLAPFRVTIKALQEAIYPSFKQADWLSIETVDRIQGMTCDLTIYLIPFPSHHFAFQTNRFNVATSRATKGTLIVTDKQVDGSGAGVAKFWKIVKCSHLLGQI